MNKALAIMHMYPLAIPLVDFSVYDDGDGQYIAQWDLTELQPTEAELEEAWIAYEAVEASKPIPKSAIELRLEATEGALLAIMDLI